MCANIGTRWCKLRGWILSPRRYVSLLVSLNPNLKTLLVSYDEFKKASEAELQPRRIHEGTLSTYTIKLFDS